VPELPEVEWAVRRLAPHVVGHRLTHVERAHPTARRALSAARATALRGRVVTALTRRGKYQCFTLDDQSTLIAHFRLDGDWAVRPLRDALPRHARVILSFEAGHRVALLDPRALATITWHRASESPLASLGPEPWDPALDDGGFHQRLATRRAAIKQVLLDQHVVAGIGNIYAAEALWHARVHPEAPAFSISAMRAERVLHAVRHALQRGLDAPGRVFATAESADTSHDLMVYGRDGEACRHCHRPIRRTTHGGRGTWWCPGCQRR
jgi:formamidopyrimidine-DNA glycosylase